MAHQTRRKETGTRMRRYSYLQFLLVWIGFAARNVLSSLEEDKDKSSHLGVSGGRPITTKERRGSRILSFFIEPTKSQGNNNENPVSTQATASGRGIGSGSSHWISGSNLAYDSTGNLFTSQQKEPEHQTPLHTSSENAKTNRSKDFYRRGEPGKVEPEKDTGNDGKYNEKESNIIRGETNGQRKWPGKVEPGKHAGNDGKYNEKESKIFRGETNVQKKWSGRGEPRKVETGKEKQLNYQKKLPERGEPGKHEPGKVEPEKDEPGKGEPGKGDSYRTEKQLKGKAHVYTEKKRVRSYITTPTSYPINKTLAPTYAGTDFPTYAPTQKNLPTYAPTKKKLPPPTDFPTFSPTKKNLPPTTDFPTFSPTDELTAKPTNLLVCDPPITPEQREEELYSIVSELSPQSDILTPGSSQNEAFRWLAFEDPAQVCPEQRLEVTQRYTMALLYYSTGGGEWYECSENMQSPCPGVRYLSEANVCSWFNTTCGPDDSLVGIGLVANNLVGTIPDELSSLPELMSLDLMTNNVTGSLPDTLFDAFALTYLLLEDNDLMGAISPEIEKMENLKILQIDRNMFTGTLTSQIGQLADLEFLTMDNNDLTGTIPDSYANLSNLRAFSVQSNNLNGELPSFFGSLQDLETINLFNNQFVGGIPSDLGNLQLLENMFLHFNDFEGSMPEEICQLRNGNLKQLTADCLPGGLVQCPQPECCTACF